MRGHCAEYGYRGCIVELKPVVEIAGPLILVNLHYLTPHKLSMYFLSVTPHTKVASVENNIDSLRGAVPRQSLSKMPMINLVFYCTAKTAERFSTGRPMVVAKVGLYILACPDERYLPELCRTRLADMGSHYLILLAG